MSLVYNWEGSLAALLITMFFAVVGRFLIFKIPAIARTYADNRAENYIKRQDAKYMSRLDVSNKIAMACNIFFYIAMVPFIASFEMQPIWQMLLDVFLILMIYDFFYYVMHRFLFHGKGFFRKVHGIHHQARKITSGDSLLLHPLEAFMGIALFMLTTVGYSVIAGHPLHIGTLVVVTLIFTTINQVNHARIDLNYFPFNTINAIAYKHSLHHVDMHQGNYATITLLYDKMFGTYE